MWRATWGGHTSSSLCCTSVVRTVSVSIQRINGGSDTPRVLFPVARSVEIRDCGRGMRRPREPRQGWKRKSHVSGSGMNGHRGNPGIVLCPRRPCSLRISFIAPLLDACRTSLAVALCEQRKKTRRVARFPGISFFCPDAGCLAAQTPLSPQVREHPAVFGTEGNADFAPLFISFRL